MLYNKEMQEIIVLNDLERIKTLSDPLRIQVLRLLIDRQATVKQLADNLGQSSAKIHYHVKEMEKRNIISLVETIEKGGIMEKYYRAAAKNYKIHYEISLK
ncbi:MAG: helix-turn-helix transcriptional regulator [Clostridia bacterium]|nr:helix-turn-helix transcriptional regulator [Clostridia bacterium]